MKCNWMRWLWGIIPLLILGWVAVEAEHRRLEKDLAERSQAALQAAGLSWAASAYQGRDGILSGKALDVADPEKALGVLNKVWGVRIVNNRTDLIEQVDNYHWAASRKNKRIRLTGYVPNKPARDTIMGVARASFPGFEIQDRMTLARGVPSVDTWLGGVSFALKQLTNMQRGDVRLDMLSLSATGEAEDANAYRALRAMGNSMPKGVKLGAAQITPPTVSPHVWTAKFDGKSMLFKGHVPSDTEEAYVLAAAREKLADSAISDDADPGAGAAQGWKEMAALAVRQLVKLENGQAEIKDNALTISGLAADEATAEAVRQALKGMPASFKLSDQLSVKPKPKPAEPPPAPAPLTQAPVPEPTIALAPVPPPPPAPDLQPRPEQPKVAVTEPVTPPVPPAPAPKAPEPPPPAAPKLPATVPPAVVPPAAIPPPMAASPAEVRAARACEENLTKLAGAGTILFRYASAELSQTSFETLEKLANAAKGCPDTIIEIGGFASAEGSPFANLRLSESRAQSVLSYLVKAGVDAKQLEAKGYGIARPAAPNTSAENMAKNRRIEFAVRPKPAQR